MQISTTNVNHALPIMVNMMIDNGSKQSSRNGDTLELPGVTVIEYQKPNERVLFNATRDANPFFHYQEALWMFAGRQDVDFLTQFVKTMSNFSDDGIIFNAGYGHRIRRAFGFDQFRDVIEVIRQDRNTRQAVVQLWDTSDLTKMTKDKACNTQMVFKQRNGKLHLTVFNRSNDLIWGALGANVVHFSSMLEYVARAVDAEVGTYSQVSNCMHAYMTPQWEKLRDELSHDPMLGAITVNDPYEKLENAPHNLVDVPEYFLQEAEKYCDNPTATSHTYFNKTFVNVAQPMYHAYFQHKQGDTYGAINLLDRYMVDCDWKTACKQWLTRRLK